MASGRKLRSVIVCKDDASTFKLPTCLKQAKEMIRKADKISPISSSKIQQIFSDSDTEYLSANDSSHDRSQIDNEVMEILDNNGIYNPGSDDEYSLSLSQEDSPPNTSSKNVQDCTDSWECLKRNNVISQYTPGDEDESKNKKARQNVDGSTKNRDEYYNDVVDFGSLKKISDSQAWLKLGLTANLMYKLCGPNYNALNKPVGVAQLPTGEVVVADTFNDRMVLFTAKGKFEKSFAAPNMLRPAAVVTLKTGNFIVKDHHGIDHFDGDCKYIGPLYHSALLKKPYGLALTDQGKIITMETGKEGFITLVFLDIFGKDDIVRVLVNLNLTSREAAFSKPRFITHQGGNMVLVVDLGLNCIFKIECSMHLAQGTVSKKIGGKGTKHGEFIDPSGIVVDDDRYIMVGDSKNHRIQLFDSEGEFLSVLKFDVPLKRPSGMYLTKEGELLVINYWENNVARYRLSME